MVSRFAFSLVLVAALGVTGCATRNGPPTAVPRRTTATIEAIERAAAESREYEARMQEQVRELREELYRTALSLKDYKMRIDEIATALGEHSAAVTNLLRASEQARAALAAAEARAQDAAAIEAERAALRAKLADEQDRSRREQQIAAEKEQQIADLRAALAARDDKAAPEPRRARKAKDGDGAPAVVMPPPVEAAPAPQPPPEPAKSRAKADAGETMDDKTLVKLVAEGNRYLAKGRLEQAHDRFTRALEGNPQMNGARVGLAACLYMMDDLPGARRLANEVLDDGSSMVAEALGLRGIINWKEGRLDDAEFDCREAVDRAPNDAQLRNYFGIVLHARRQTADAIAQFRRAVEINPDNTEALLNMAILLATGPTPDLAEARMRYQQALALGVERDPALDRILGVAEAGR